MIALLFLLAAAAADAPTPKCAQMAPVAGFEGWAKPAASALTVGSAATLALKPATTVHFEPALTRPAKTGTYGGFFPLTVARAGHYRIAVSQGAWIDLVGKGERLKSIDHAHGAACSGIAKIVAYDLKPGRYWLQLSEAKEKAIGAMVSSH